MNENQFSESEYKASEIKDFHANLFTELSALKLNLIKTDLTSYSHFSSEKQASSIYIANENEGITASIKGPGNFTYFRKIAPGSQLEISEFLSNVRNAINLEQSDNFVA